MMLDLPNVTLLFVETRAHKITKRVIDDCISKVNFGAILIYTDNPALIPVEGARYIAVPDFTDKRAAGQFYYQYAMREVTTDFALMLEWDAGIKNTAMWTPEFLQYDCIGAPWRVRQQEENCLDVGNGGFMLMSKKLGHFLAAHQHDFPVFTDWDVCRTFRPRLEAHGFKWPRRDLASRFSWELTPMPDNDAVFGFHATFTWPWMLAKEEIITRAKLLTETPYLLSKMGDLIKKAPWLENELGEELFGKFQNTHPAAMSYAGRTGAAQRANMLRTITQRRALYASQMNKGGLKA